MRREFGHRALDRLLAVGGRRGQERLQCLRRRSAQPGVVGARHDRAQAAHPAGVGDGDLLGDHPAHGHPDDVRRGELQVVEDGDAVVSHVAQVVGDARPASADVFPGSGGVTELR